MITQTEEQKSIAAILSYKIASLGLSAKFVEPISEGPVVTVYRFLPQGSTRVSHLEGLARDFAVALGVEAVQVTALPREAAVGIFIPNKQRKDLKFTDTVSQVWKEYWKDGINTPNLKIPICLGMSTDGSIIIEDLTKLPHLLVAGSTGSGKSTLLNSILATFVYCVPSTKLRLILCDTKKVEFTLFDNAPHLLFPVAKDVPAVVDALDDICKMVESRLINMASKGCQNILQYNTRFVNYPRSQMPYIALVIDELAAPLQDPRKESDEKGAKTFGKLAEYRLGKIASEARATGIHVIAATQRTSVKVVEGNIKANFPARISFRLPSEYDSRTILGSGGAESLLSQGDMLFVSPNNPAIRRVHSPYATQEDIKIAIEMATHNERKLLT